MNRASGTPDGAFRLLFESHPQPMWVYDRETLAFLAVNNAALEKYGYSRDEFLGMTIKDIRPEEDVARLLENVAAQRPPWQESGEWRHRLKDGRVIEVEITSHALDYEDRPATLVAAQDISKRAEMQKALHYSQERYGRLLDNMIEGCQVIDREFRYVYVNAAAARHGRQSVEELLGRTMMEMYPGIDQTPLFATLRRCMEQRSADLIENEFTYPDSSLGWFALSIQPVEEGLLILSSDISERRRAEERIRQVIEASPNAILVADQGGSITWTNAAAAQMFGYSRDSLTGMSIDLLVPDELRAGHVRLRAAYADEPVQRPMGHGRELVARRKDGSLFPVEIALSPVETSDGQLFLSEITDISARKQAETHIRRLNRVYAVLTSINHAIVHQREPQALFEVACRIAVEKGHFRLAWIGLVDPATRGIGVVARAGDDHGYLDALDLRAGQEEPNRGLVAQVVASGQREVCNDIATDPRVAQYREAALALGYHSLVSLPLKGADDIRGVLNIYAEETDFFDEEELRLLDEMAADISFALEFAEREAERKGLEQLESEMRSLAETLLDITTAINSSLKRVEVLAYILDSVKRVIPHDGANIMLLTPYGDELKVAGACKCYEKNGLGTLEVGLTIPLDTRPALKTIIETGQPVVIADARAAGDWTVDAGEENWIGSYAGAPITSGETIIGVINVDSRTPGAFSEQDAFRLQAFADQAAIAIRNAQFYEELEIYNSLLEQAVEEQTAELVKAKERVEAILNNSPQAILLLKPNGLISTGNPAFFELFGYAPDDMYEHAPVQLVTVDSAGAMDAAIRSVIEQQETQWLEIVAQRKDGSTFEASIALAPIKEKDQLLGLVCNILDISQRKEIERMKDAFVANVSHELRTPITSLKLNHGLIKMDPARQEVFMGRLGREIDRLNDLIEDLLRLSRLDLGRYDLKLERVDLGEIAGQLAADRGPLAEGNEQTMQLDLASDLPPVEADAGLLGQAFSVLLTNALNYTPAGGTITLGTHTRKINGNRWVGLSVADSGPGIDPEELPNLFQRFYRGKVGQNSGRPGTGLGLAISHEITRRHGGHIDVASPGPGKGAAFTIWLPEAEPEEEGQMR